MSNAIWILPLCLLIVGFFGMFWILALSDVQITITINMDNNSLEAVKEISYMQERQINYSLLTNSSTGGNSSDYNLNSSIEWSIK